MPSGILALIQAGPWSEQSQGTTATEFAIKLKNKGGIQAAQRINHIHNADIDHHQQYAEFFTGHCVRPHRNPRQKSC